jgi:hypothetical protein
MSEVQSALHQMEADIELSPRETPGLHFTTALRCPLCKTLIRYVDQAPPWRESESRRAELEQARQWAEQNLGVAVPQMWMSGTPPIVSEASRHRGLIDYEATGGLGPSIVRGVVDVDLRCVDCPACGSEVYLDRHVVVDPNP